VAAVKLLEWNVINAIVRDGLSDEMAERIVVESNLNQQSFGDWKYSQQIKVIKIYDKYLQESSQQGKRNDLTDKQADAPTGDHNEHKSAKKEKRPKSRDKISKQLGISSSVFVRYRSIAKLDDRSLDIICNMLDERRLGFMSAFRLSQLKPNILSSVLDLMASILDVNFRGPNVKLLCESIMGSDGAGLTTEEMRNILLPDVTAQQ
jgi:hypothetical protein